MIKKTSGLVAAAAMLMLGGCASMSSEECLVSDWHAIGYEDGSRGYTADRIGERRKACAKHGVPVDFQSYRAGHDEGLRDFCQPARGFRLGSNGGQYHGLCAADLEPRFLDAYRTGQQLHALRSNVNSTDYQINARKNEIASIEGIMRNKEAALIGRDTPTEERILLVSDLKRHAEHIGELEAEIMELSEDRVIYEQELRSYEAVLADSGYY